MTGRRFLLFFLLLFAVAPRLADAAEGAWAERREARSRLIAAPDAVGDSTLLPFGLEIEMAPGWKTYWRSPGDAGIPTSFDWSESENVAAVEFLWPAPIRFTLFGLDTFGYEGRVVFPLQVTPQTPGQPVTLAGTVIYMVCEDICIPFEEKLSLTLPAGPAEPTPAGFAIEEFRARVPGDGSATGLTLGSAALQGSVDAPRLEVLARSRIPFAAPDLIVEGPAGYVFKAPEVALSPDGREARLSMTATLGPQVSQPLEGAPLTLTLTDGGRAAERQLTPAGTLSAAADFRTLPLALAPDDLPTFLSILGLALLGGLILNLMPCVLPVLSLKLLSVVEQGGREGRAIRRGFLASAAGILVSFLALAGGILAVRAAGLSVGWGIQFQSPVFLALMAVVVTLFAANLFGFFEIPLPGGAARLAPQGRETTLTGHFATGFLATLLATPCSAPFLGTAIGFALLQDAGKILAIFFVMGLGLALPYLTVAGFPALARWLPRPGRWMRVLRLLLGLALLGTAVWLLLVARQQIGDLGLLLLAALLLLLLLLLAVRRPLAARPLRRSLMLATAALALAAVLLPTALPQRSDAAAGLEGWTTFDEAAIPRLVAQGRTVFVDVTADWCVTCKANKSLVLDTPAVAAALQKTDIVAMQADWTRPDPAIASFLQRFGRYGIPFNIVFGPAAPQGLPLPELLSQTAVLEALAAAARR